MKYILAFLLVLSVIFSTALFSKVAGQTVSPSSSAFPSPTPIPNNKFGVHILFPSEVEQAARLVNSSGGDWGYITIPIQAADKDLQKWQSFMDACRRYHLIPIVRLATEGDYFETSSWRKPDFADVLDFANFLSSLNWPTKNRYVVVFNEVNHQTEWGGDIAPAEYAQILSYAVTVFKSKSPDFFVISAGLDNASINSLTSMNALTYIRQMNQAVPGIFNQVDGVASHPYPNPAFSSSPQDKSWESIHSFEYEENLIDSISSKTLPIFLTETGWSKQNLSDEQIASYFDYAYANVWNNDRIIAVTPFLLFAQSGPFADFSILGQNLKDTPLSNFLRKMQKVAGKPVINPDVLAAHDARPEYLPIKDFPEKRKNIVSQIVKNYIRMVFPAFAVVK